MHSYSIDVFCQTGPFEAFCQACRREGRAAVSPRCPSQAAQAQAKQIARWTLCSAASQRNGLIRHTLCGPAVKGLLAFVHRCTNQHMVLISHQRCAGFFWKELQKLLLSSMTIFSDIPGNMLNSCYVGYWWVHVLYEFSKQDNIKTMNSYINRSVITNIRIAFLFKILTAEWRAVSWFPFCSVLTITALMILRCKLSIWQKNEKTKHMKAVNLLFIHMPQRFLIATGGFQGISKINCRVAHSPKNCIAALFKPVSKWLLSLLA